MRKLSQFSRYISRPCDPTRLDPVRIKHYNTLNQTLSTSIEQDIPNSISTIINNVNPMEPALEPFVPFLTPQLVHALIANPKNPLLGLRFFVWAMRKRGLRNWVTQKLAIEMVTKNGFDSYWRVLEDVKGCGFYVDSVGFNVLIRAYAKVGLAEKAVETFGKMREFDVTPTTFSFNSVLHVLMEKRLALLGLAVYNMMIKVACEPSLATFGILIDGLNKSGMRNYALRMFDEMEAKGIKPNKSIFTVAVSGSCSTDDALRLLDSMKESGVSPDSILYNSLLNKYSRLGRMDEAIALLPLFEKDGYVLDLEGYSCLIDGFFKARRFDQALMLYGKMLENGIIPDVILYTIMIKGLIAADRLKDGLKLLQEMTDNGVVPDSYSYNAVIKGFCDAGFLDEARSLRLEISEKGSFPNTSTHTILICGMCKNGLLAEARQIFSEMEKLGCLPSVVTFNALIDGLCKAGELDEARLLLYQMEIGRNPSVFIRMTQGASKVLTSESLLAMVEKLCESGLILKAYKILMQLADSIAPDAKTYTILVKGFCKAGNFDVAFKLFKEMQIKGISPDTVTYGTFVDGLAKAGRVDNAIKVIDHMEKENGFLPTLSVYRILMTEFCRKKNLSSAFSVWMMYLRKLPSHDLRTIEAAEKHFEEGKIDQAVLDLIKMNFRFNNFEQGPYTILLIGLLQQRKYTDGLKLFYILREFEINVTGACCLKLIHTLCRERHLDQAAEVFIYSLEKGLILRPRVCNYLLHSLLRSEDKKKRVHATDLASRMESVGYNLHALLPRVTKQLLKHSFKHECPQSKTSLSQARFGSWKGKADCLRSKTTPAPSHAKNKQKRQEKKLKMNRVQSFYSVEGKS